MEVAALYQNDPIPKSGIVCKRNIFELVIDN
jgi:hypothetical protein